MSSSLTDARTKVSRLLQEQRITLDDATDSLNDAIKNAVDQYSQDIPIEANQSVTGNGTDVYAVPSAFTYGFSTLLDIEYPAGENPKSFLMKKYWSVFKEATGIVNIYFQRNTPSKTERFVSYFTKYTSDIADVPAYHDLAVLNLAAANACRTGSAKAAHQSNDSRRASQVDRTAPGRSLADSAKEYERRYGERLFGNKDHIAPATAVADYDTEFNSRHRRPLHPRDDT